MATKSYVMERISKLNENIAKKECLIEKMTLRISKNTEKLTEMGLEVLENPYTLPRSTPNWEKAFDLMYSIGNAKDSVESATKALKEFRNKLESYNADLAVIIEKENSRNIQVIIDFLDRWKELNVKFYKDSVPLYAEALKEYYEKHNEWTKYQNANWKLRGTPEYKERASAHKAYSAKFNRTWNYLVSYVLSIYNQANDCRDYILHEDKLRADLKAEAERKYDFIIEKTNEIVGTITDASGLHIGAKGDLNGIIIGERGSASVQTIGAGGYNIQCYHFRTIIRKINVKTE